MPLTNKVAQFDTDSDLVNEWVHGGPTTSITTDSGPVRSPAKLIADLNTSINIEADGILAQVEAVAASINVVAERADAIAAIDADVAEVQAYKIAGKVLIDSDVAALDAYRVAGQNLINEDTAALDAYRVAGQALIDADVGAVETRKIEALFTDIPAAILTMQAYNERGAWNTGVAYAIKDVYVDAGIAYVVILAHISTSVAADLAAGKVGIHQGITKEQIENGGLTQIKLNTLAGGSVTLKASRVLTDETFVIGASVTHLTGDGTTAVFNVPSRVVELYISGILQSPNSFTSTDTAITFSEAPPYGTNIEAIAANNVVGVDTLYASQISGLVKSEIGLGNVDNTSDATKNVAVATLTNKTLVAPLLGTPTSGTLTNCGGLPASGVEGTALVATAIGTTVQAYDVNLSAWAGIAPATGVGTFLATPTLANLNTLVSDADLARIDVANAFTDNQTLSTGNLIQGTAGKGINFTANTPAAGMTSQLLNWYEEGTWTPAAGGGLTVTGSFSSGGTYTRIGRLVTIRFTVTGSTSVEIGSGSSFITGIPFSSASGIWFPGSSVNSTATQSTNPFVLDNVIYSAEAIAAVGSIYGTITYMV